jgi:hypothetical protein
MNRKYQFAKMYYDWVTKCLIDDNEYETLAYFMLGCDLCIRKSELINIKWSQIESPFINNIEIMKKLNKDTKTFYPPREYSKPTANAMYLGCCNDSEKLFNNNSQWYIDRIIKSSGDDMFNGHVMRRLGIELRNSN